MQLTLNVLCFFLGIILAGVVGSKPKESRSALDDLVCKFCYVFNALWPSAHGQNSEAANHRKLVETDDVDLLTK